MSLPSADDLFRPTVEAVPDEDGSGQARPAGKAPRARSAESRSAESRPGEAPRARSAEARPAEDAPRARPSDEDRPAPAVRRPSGRVRHDEKMTVYVTADELHDLESARLTLRRTGLAVDRGRLVRAAIALALADLETHGEDSTLVQRLRDA